MIRSIKDLIRKYTVYDQVDQGADPEVQGGSDKSGIFKIFLENPTAQLKIIRF